MTAAWKFEDDFKNDLWEFSELCQEDDETEEPTPPAILQYKATMEANSTGSIFDTDYHQEPVTYVSTGRGRGGISQMFRPGIVNDKREDEHSIEKYLREVSGLGYSNELIVKSFRKSTPQPIEEFCDAESDSNCKEFGLLRQSQEKSKNTSSSSVSNKLSNGSTLNTPSPVEKTAEDSPPPPLSVILSRGKKNTKTDKENTVRKKGCMLNPDAPEFQISDIKMETAYSNGVPATSSSKSIFQESDSPQGYQDYSSSEEESVPLWRRSNNERTSSDDNLSWRNRSGSDNGFSPRSNRSSGRDFTRNFNFNIPELLLHNNRPFETNGLSWRQKDKSYNIESDSDFPPL